MKKFIILIIFLGLAIPFLFWMIKDNLPAEKEGPTTLTYWGFWEESLIKPLISKYESENPQVKINYVKQSLTNYRTRVQIQIREGVGPDIFKLHNSWLPMFANDLSVVPQDIYSLTDYQGLFYPVIVDNFVKNDQIYSIPLEIDGLALFVNIELLNNVGVSEPKNWQEFVAVANKITVKDTSGVIKTAGAALGTTSNVDHWPEILGLLLLQQPGVDLKNLSSPVVAEVLKYYTGFVLDPSRKTWDVNLPSSTQSFAAGNLAFYFGPSWRAQEIKKINPNLNFKVMPVPQLPSSKVAWATFWGEAVSLRSKNQKEAWKFVKFLSSPDSQKLLAAAGQPLSRIDLASEQISDPILGAFVAQGPIYKSWYLNSNTFDAGINEEVIKQFENAVNSILQGISAEDTLQSLNTSVKQVLEKYGVR